MSVYNDGFSFAESSDSFIIDIDRTSDEYKIWQGLVGAHYTPYVDAEGNLSWTNNGDLPNPPTQNIRGAPGTGLTIKGIVATVGDLPQSASNGDTYLVGTDAPYEGYLYTNNQWVDIGEIGVGQPGRGIVSIAKTSSTGTNPVIDTYTITYTDSTTSTFLVTNGVKGDTGTAAGFGTPTATIDANTGTPSVTVTASGSSTAKVFAFAFHNLKGAKGDPGATGQGVPTGGTTGQVLKKTSATDYATEWANPLALGSSAPLSDGTATAGTATTASHEDHVHPTDTTRQEQITASGMLKGAGSGSVSAATKGTDYGALSFTVTLTVAGWSNKAQTVSNSNFVTSGYAYMVSPASTSFLDYGSAQIYADDVTTNGQMTFHCEDVPSSALTVNIVRAVSA